MEELIKRIQKNRPDRFYPILSLYNKSYCELHLDFFPNDNSSYITIILKTK
jgi:hypothetical protein